MAQVFELQEHRASQPSKKVYPSSLEKTRKAITRLLNEFLVDPEADTARFRASVYALKACLDSHRMEKEVELEDRLVAVEKELGLRQ